MSALDYLKALMPSFRRNQILENVSVIQTSVREHLLPAYISADKLFQNNKPKSSLFKERQRQYEVFIGRKITSGSTLVTALKANLETTIGFLDTLETVSKDSFSEVETNLGISYTKVNVLRLIEAADFFVNYSGQFLNQLLIEETLSAEEGQEIPKMKGPELAYLEKHFSDYLLVCRILERDTSKIKERLAQLPQATVTDLTEKTFPSTMKPDQLDPFGVRGLSASASPIFFVGMIIANYQASNYKAKKENLELLRLRIYNLQRMYEGKNDLSIQREIVLLQDRVSGLQADIAKKGVQYGL